MEATIRVIAGGVVGEFHTDIQLKAIPPDACVQIFNRDIEKFLDVQGILEIIEGQGIDVARVTEFMVTTRFPDSHMYIYQCPSKS